MPQLSLFTVSGPSRLKASAVPTYRYRLSASVPGGEIGRAILEVTSEGNAEIRLATPGDPTDRVVADDLQSMLRSRDTELVTFINEAARQLRYRNPQPGQRTARGRNEPLSEAQAKRIEEAKTFRLKPGISKAMRLRAGLSQREVAEACGFAHSDHVARLEKSDDSLPLEAVLRFLRLMHLSGMTLNDILE